MVTMRVMQMAVDQVVDVIAMRDRLVPATGSVPMAGSTPLSGRAAIGILLAELDRVLVHMSFVRMMEMSIVEIIDVIVVPHGDVSAAWPVDMRMIGVNRMVMSGHGAPFLV